MTVITVNLDDELIVAADARAQEMTRTTGVKVSRSAVVNLALRRLLSPLGSIDSSMSGEQTKAEPVAA